MKPPHVVIVNQNALLELDLRPRREAETLAAAGYWVTLVGGCRAPETRPRGDRCRCETRALRTTARLASASSGQIREQSQAMARAMMAVRRAS